jgi:hypothetical protein
MPCMLIGYAPHSKAYRLWDNTSGNIFNSFHITFIEHLDSSPSDLLPGTTLLLEPDAPPSWEVPTPELTATPSHTPSVPSSRARSSHNSAIPCSSPIIPTFDLPSTPLTSIPPATLPPSSIIPPPPTPIPPVQPQTQLRRSNRLAKLPPTTALLAEFSKLADTHDLLPLSAA